MYSSEAELIQGLKNKEEESYNILIEKYSTNLMRGAYIIMKDEGLAEEIVQNTFIKIIKNINQFRGQSSLYTYLYRIAVNECRQKLRKNWFKRVVLFKEWRIDDKSHLNFEEMSIDKLVISKAISKLSLKYKEVILLYYYEDFSVKEICKITGEKEGTIKSRMKRARDIMKVSLIEEGYKYER